MGAIPVGFLGLARRFSGDLIDISTTGILVTGPEDIELGSVGRVGIPIRHETIRIGVTVRRILPGVGVAMEFSNMTPHGRELLHRLLLFLAKPPSP